MIQRFTPSNPCPICGGYQSERLRGTGRRCWGFIGKDGAIAFCTRTDLAGGLLVSNGCGAYRHDLTGPCGCGGQHGASPAPLSLKGHRSGDYRDDGPLGTPVAVYVYEDENGKPVHRTVRYADPKGFRQQRYEMGEWLWGLKGMKRVLYRLPALLEATTQPVFLTEGEKDADTLHGLGYVATTNSDGALTWRKHYNTWLRRRDVIIVEDSDSAGATRTDMLVTALCGVASRLRVACFPDQRRGYDISDYVADHGGIDGLTSAMYDTGAARLITKRSA
ncbi:MAG: hypothetical protein LC754_10485 [Acidobacteria bacterium]|nr:hypothetical protein [Acidobacteriota bacterium]